MKFKLFVLLLLSGLLVSCTGIRDDSILEEESVTLRIGVMPAVDSAPIWWAQKQGLFEKYCVEVVPVLFTDSKMMQESIEMERLDANMISIVEFIENIDNNREFGKITTTTDGKFRLVLSPQYDTFQKGNIALMKNSITNFLADNYLEDYVFEKHYINEIFERMDMLETGRIDMAILPEPIASKAEADGMVKKKLGTPNESIPNVIVFTKKALDRKTNAIQAFHLAYNEAVDDMLGKDMQVKRMIAQSIGLDETVVEYMELPTYRRVNLPNEKVIRTMKEWSELELGKKFRVSYRQMVDKRFAH